MWINQPCGLLNKTASIAACLLLYGHVLFLVSGFWFDRQYKYMEHETKLWLLFVAVMVLMVGVIRVVCRHGKHTYCSVPNRETRHLQWDFPRDYQMIVLPILIIIAVFFVRPMRLMWSVLGLYMMARVVSFYTADPCQPSIWCWMCAFFSFIVYIINR